jgi:hypothetical protein
MMHTSGPKGLKDGNVYAGDKSPAYPEDEFFRSLFSPYPPFPYLPAFPSSLMSGLNP